MVSRSRITSYNVCYTKLLRLGIMPYITSSIIFSLLTVSFPRLAEIQKEPGGYKKINKWSRYATVLLCAIQGYGLAVGLEMTKGQSGLPIVIDPGMSFRLMTVITLSAGTVFLMCVITSYSIHYTKLYEYLP